MKRVLCIAAAVLLLVTITACGSTEKASDEWTVQMFLDNKDFPEGKVMTVTVTSFINPVLAVVEDQSGASVNLFGVFVDGEMKDFASLEIKEGTSITIKNGKYNVYEGTIEIAEAELVSVN